MFVLRFTPDIVLSFLERHNKIGAAMVEPSYLEKVLLGYGIVIVDVFSLGRDLPVSFLLSLFHLFHHVLLRFLSVHSHHGLLRMQAVLASIEYNRLRTVYNIGGDLFAAVAVRQQCWNIAPAAAEK
jgi:hypothetical protein